MNAHILSLVKPQWRSAFVGLVETGEASQAFLDYFESDRNALQAAELVFNEQTREFRPIVMQLLRFADSQRFQ